MMTNRLKLNADKTQLIWLGTRQQLSKLTVSQLCLTTSVVEFASTAKDLGVVLDNPLSIESQVTAVCRSCFYQLRSFKTDVPQSLVQAFIHCWLDYCNALLTGIAKGQIKRLQAVQNAAPCLVSGAHRHATTAQHSLVASETVSYLQNCCPCLEMYPWRCSSLPSRAMHSSGQLTASVVVPRLRSASTG